MSILNEIWSSVLGENQKLKNEFENLRELLDLRLEHLMGNPGMVRPLFGMLRHHKPIFIAPRISVLTKYDDVVEALKNDSAFSAAPIYAKKMQMTTGDFVLGMANTPQYQRESALMRQSVHEGDLDRIKAFVSSQATDLVTQAKPRGRMDLVGELSRVVPMRFAGDYFGTPGDHEATMMGWMRSIFREIFLNLGNDPKMQEESEADAKALNSYLDKLIAARKADIAAGTNVTDDFVTRLINIQSLTAIKFEDEVIRRILGGTIVGTVDTNSKAVAQLIDVLLNRPNELAGAQAAAKADDDDLLAHYIFEALRFNPQNPFLIRMCQETTTIAAGTSREAEIPKGDLVIVGTESAMCDEDIFPEPDTFHIDRPMENYIHFGAGMHTCFGALMAGLIIPTVAKAVLRCDKLRRADGPDGQLQYDGAFPNRMIVEFE